MRRLQTWATGSEGSTRSMALMRISLIAIVWGRWANDLVVYRHITDGYWPFCVVFFPITTMAFIGLFTRITMPMTAAATAYMVFYMGHYRGYDPYTHHHTTVLAWATFLLSLGPCGRSYSVDRWLSVRRARQCSQSPPPERGNLWAQRLLAVQVAAIYFWAGIDKLNVGFLSGARLQHFFMFYYSGSRAIDDIPGVTVATAVMAWGTVALEFSLALGLWFRRTRRWLVIPGLLLHGVFYMVLSVFTYSVTMWALYLAFLDPDRVHVELDRLQGLPDKE